MEKQQRILLVDDNKVTMEGITSHLSRNYRVHTAFTGLDALKVFEEHRKNLHLVITDMVMPDVSGGALISIIKAKSPVTPVIAMTGWGQHPSALAAEAKADVVLVKPFELEELDQSISKLLPTKAS
jgi:DNA-binding NtrC family response regulator